MVSESRIGQDSLDVTVVEEVSELLCFPHIAQTVAAWPKAFCKEKRFTGRSVFVRAPIKGSRASTTMDSIWLDMVPNVFLEMNDPACFPLSLLCLQTELIFAL